MSRWQQPHGTRRAPTGGCVKNHTIIPDVTPDDWFALRRRHGEAYNRWFQNRLDRLVFPEIPEIKPPWRDDSWKTP